MTSQLNVDTIVDKAGTGGTNVKVANTSTYVSDGGNVTQNTVAAMAKSWCRMSHTASLQNTFNISSASDDGTGDYSVLFTNNMSDNTSSGNANAITSFPYSAQYHGVNTTGYSIDIHNDSGNNSDSGNSHQTFGDLA